MAHCIQCIDNGGGVCVTESRSLLHSSHILPKTGDDGIEIGLYTLEGGSYQNNIRQHCETHIRNSGNLSERRCGGQLPKIIIDVARDCGDLLDVDHYIVHAQLSSPEASQHKGGEEKGTEHIEE
jgi:hypothetical protein